MTPMERAAELYASEPCARTLEEDLAAHFQTGYVFATPESLVLARGVQRAADHADIVNPWVEFPRDSHDAWMIYLAVGIDGLALIKQCAIWLPYRLPWIARERHNHLRFFDFKHYSSKIMFD